MIGPTLATGFGMSFLSDAINNPELRRDTPHPNSSMHHYGPLEDAMFERVREIAPQVEEPKVGRKEYTRETAPTESKLASMQQATYKDGSRSYQVNINPNTDSAYYAHELGHIASRQTKAGRFIANARDALHSNPKLGKALALALGFSVPAVGAALQEGDDDLAASLAISAAVASPVLLDEALATKNGLAIMAGAGRPANAGQRGRLATAYLSYLAPVILGGGTGYLAGNAIDEHTALYDL